MNYALLLIVFAVLTGALSFYWLRSSQNRIAMVAIYFGLMIFSVAAVADVMGYSKPYPIEWRSMNGLKVIGIYQDKAEKTTYFWALRDGRPMVYSYPWGSDKQQEELQEKRRRSQDEGGELVLSDDDLGYEFSEPEVVLRKD